MSRGDKLVLIIAIAILMLVVGITESLLVLNGIVPRERIAIKLSTPLYPYNYTYIYNINVYLGRGLYITKLSAKTSMHICILCGNNTLSINLDKENSRTIRLWCSSGSLNLVISAHMKPYEVNAGVIEVARKWR